MSSSQNRKIFNKCLRVKTYLFIYCDPLPYNNCITEPGAPQQLNMHQLQWAPVIEITDSNAIANAFNNFNTKIGHNLAQSIQETT